MKQLGFVSELIPLVLSGEKTITWRRCPYDFEIGSGDVLDLVESKSRKLFAKAKVVWVKDTTFGKMTKEETSGHEKFASKQDMYDTYSKYFQQKVNEETPVKVVKFELIERF